MTLIHLKSLHVKYIALHKWKIADTSCAAQAGADSNPRFTCPFTDLVSITSLPLIQKNEGVGKPEEEHSKTASFPSTAVTAIGLCRNTKPRITPGSAKRRAETQ